MYNFTNEEAKLERVKIMFSLFEIKLKKNQFSKSYNLNN